MAGTASPVSDPFAKRVNIGDGRWMYIECRGEGCPPHLDDVVDAVRAGKVSMTGK